MNKKLIILVVLLIVIVIIIGIFINFYFKVKRDKCNAISGGRFHIVFETDGGEELDILGVGVGISPDSYPNLPVPIRDGYTFEGWYYDSKLTDKVDSTSTRDISPVAEYDKHKCFTGFKTITLYAKWLKK